MPFFQIPTLSKIAKQVFFKGLGLYILCTLGCGGSGITFPQGPTSGADDLGMIVPQVSLRPHPEFRLAVYYDDENETLKLQWNSPVTETCKSYRLALIETPDIENGFDKAKLLHLPIDTRDLAFTADENLITDIQSESRSVSIVVFCIPENQDERLRLPQPRSNIENLSDLILDASS